MENILSNIMEFSGPPKKIDSRSQIRSDNMIKNTMKVVKRERKLGLLCFSKERPYQLYQFLRSVQFYVQPATEVATTVLCLPGKYELEYKQVQSCFPKVEVEIESGSFKEHLSSIFLAYQKRGITHIMFCVDDLVFTNSVSLM